MKPFLLLNKSLTKSILLIIGVFTFNASFSQSPLIITELMINPVDVTDNEGEWVEIYNTTNDTIKLGKYILKSGSATFVIPKDSHLIITPKQYLVFGSGSGQIINFSYSSINFVNTGSDDFSISDTGNVLIDMVTYSSSKPGVSKSLSLNSFSSSDNDLESNWCDGTRIYNSTDKGTPGTSNIDCPGVVTGFTITEKERSYFSIHGRNLTFNTKVHSVKMYNINGISLAIFSENESNKGLNLSQYPAGLYLIKVLNEEKERIFKILLQ